MTDKRLKSLNKIPLIIVSILFAALSHVYNLLANNTPSLDGVVWYANQYIIASYVSSAFGMFCLLSLSYGCLYKEGLRDTGKNILYLISSLVFSIPLYIVKNLPIGALGVIAATMFVFISFDEKCKDKKRAFFVIILNMLNLLIAIAVSIICKSDYLSYLTDIASLFVISANSLLAIFTILPCSTSIIISFLVKVVKKENTIDDVLFLLGGLDVMVIVLDLVLIFNVHTVFFGLISMLLTPVASFFGASNIDDGLDRMLGGYCGSLVKVDASFSDNVTLKESIKKMISKFVKVIVKLITHLFSLIGKYIEKSKRAFVTVTRSVNFDDIVIDTYILKKSLYYTWKSLCEWNYKKLKRLLM